MWKSRGGKRLWKLKHAQMLLWLCVARIWPDKSGDTVENKGSRVRDPVIVSFETVRGEFRLNRIKSNLRTVIFICAFVLCLARAALEWMKLHSSVIGHCIRVFHYVLFTKILYHADVRLGAEIGYTVRLSRNLFPPLKNTKFLFFIWPSFVIRLTDRDDFFLCIYLSA